MDRDRDGKGSRQDANTRPLQPGPAPRTTEAEEAAGAPPRRVTEVQGWDAVPTQSTWPSSSGSGPLGDEHSPARYRIEAVIGRGGMGEVVSAHDEQIGRSVAIKRLRAPNAPADIVARFMREARIQGRLDHPAIPPVHELWHDERGQPFFVMKQLSGITLSEVLARLARGDAQGDAQSDEARRRFTRQHLLRAFVDVCLAIEFAHTRGVVHRDLKPANVMLGEFGDVYVLDWGVARVIASGAPDIPPDLAPATAPAVVGDTVAGLVLGTPGYMSPEQVRGDADLDGRADVYALGCILFEILAGEPLHSAGEAGLAEAKAGVDARPSRRAPDREIPPELDAVCAKATRLDRAARYATARAVGDAVQRFLDGDRDVATRAKLAASELAVARAALERGPAATDRRTALRAAARALALDPSSHEAAELVARLMIEPPPEIPQEVERELAALDDQALQAQSRLGALAMLSYLVFFPIMIAAGLRETWFVIAGPAVAALTMGATYSMSRRPVKWLIYASFAGNTLLVAIVSRALSPFLIAPSLGAMLVTVYAMHPRIGRGWALWATLAGAVMLPWVAELGGLLSPTTFITEHGIVLHLAGEHLDTSIFTIALAQYTLVILAVATALSRALTVNRVAMQHSLHLQAWQLRQLVPRGAGRESFATIPRPPRRGSTGY
jgi:serine/threonine protein kinase